eukprot:TRINITY_DN12975_c0_g1_i1.p1 TRINITY_DN12975_c0_g1~~TRINITY_DN12975_c0_g1_i1.p1  ORF type:complete len:422 (+),score=150.27 TRINITY_DN12975_c0_g1_i1:45-1310(+)
MAEIRPWSRAVTPMQDAEMAGQDPTMDEAVSKAKRLAKIQERQKMYQYRHESLIDVVSWAQAEDTRGNGNRDHYSNDPLATVPSSVQQKILKEAVGEAKRREIAAALGPRWNNPIEWGGVFFKKTEALVRGGDVARLRLHLLHTKPNVLEDLRNERSSLLHAPCETGDLATLILLVSEFKFSLATKCPAKGTLLHTAASRGVTCIAAYLLSYDDHISGLNVASPKTSDTPLHEAARNGCTEVIRLLLEKGAGINTVNVHSESPLILACKHGHRGAAGLLLSQYHHCLDVNIVDVANMNAAFYCIQTGQLDLLKLVMAHGGRLDMKGLYWSPVQLAARNSTDHAAALETARYLVEELRQSIDADQVHGSAPAALALKAGNDALVDYFAVCDKQRGRTPHPPPRKPTRLVVGEDAFAAAVEGP